MTTDIKNIKYQQIEDIKVSTKTYILSTNIYFKLEEIFDKIEVVPYTIVEKKRGRKKKTTQIIPENKVSDGSIIYIQYQNKYKGCKKKNKKNTYFRNSITTIMIVDDKKINFKITKNGKIQMTGCKYYKHSQKCIKYFWTYIKSPADQIRCAERRSSNLRDRGSAPWLCRSVS